MQILNIINVEEREREREEGGRVKGERNGGSETHAATMDIVVGKLHVLRWYHQDVVQLDSLMLEGLNNFLFS